MDDFTIQKSKREYKSIITYQKNRLQKRKNLIPSSFSSSLNSASYSNDSKIKKASSSPSLKQLNNNENTYKITRMPSKMKPHDEIKSRNIVPLQDKSNSQIILNKKERIIGVDHSYSPSIIKSKESEINSTESNAKIHHIYRDTDSDTDSIPKKSLKSEKEEKSNLRSKLRINPSTPSRSAISRFLDLPGLPNKSYSLLKSHSPPDNPFLLEAMKSKSPTFKKKDIQLRNSSQTFTTKLPLSPQHPHCYHHHHKQKRNRNPKLNQKQQYNISNTIPSELRKFSHPTPHKSYSSKFDFMENNDTSSTLLLPLSNSQQTTQILDHTNSDHDNDNNDNDNDNDSSLLEKRIILNSFSKSTFRDDTSSPDPLLCTEVMKRDWSQWRVQGRLHPHSDHFMGADDGGNIWDD